MIVLRENIFQYFPGRLFTSWYLYMQGIKHIYNIPISKSINNRRDRYYSAFRDSEIIRFIDGRPCIDITPFIVQMLEYINLAIDEVEVRKNFIHDELQLKIMRKMSSKGLGAELSWKKCSKIFNCTEEEAYVALTTLVTLEYLYKRDGVYVLKAPINL